MKKEWILIPAACLTLVFSSVAGAQGATRMGAPGKTMRIDTGKRLSASPGNVRASSARSFSNARRPTGNNVGIGSRGRGAIDLPQRDSNGRGIDRSTLNGSGLNDLGNSPLAGLLEQYLYNGRGGRGFDPYEGQKIQAKAYRDAAIAGAIVNVVGILATANQPHQGYAVCPPAAPVAPRGHVERQRILVQEGRTEEYHVWIPEYIIPETGEVVLGHNETRRREIAPVFEERDVWVPVP